MDCQFRYGFELQMMVVFLASEIRTNSKNVKNVVKVKYYNFEIFHLVFCFSKTFLCVLQLYFIELVRNGFSFIFTSGLIPLRPNKKYGFPFSSDKEGLLLISKLMLFSKI